MIKTSGNSLFLATSDSLVILDISHPSEPVITGSFECSPSDFAVVGSTVYLLTTRNKLIMIDISDPYQPLEVAQTEVPAANASRIKIQDGYAFVSDSGCIWWPCPPQLLIFDVTNPMNPTLVSTTETDGSRLDVSGRYAYLISSPGLWVIDISNHSEPSMTGSCDFDEPRPTQEVHYSAGHTYVTTYSEVIVFNVWNPTSPVQRGIVDFNTRIWNAVPGGGRLFVAEGTMGLRILEDCSVQPMENPQEFTTQQEKGAKGLSSKPSTKTPSKP